MNGFLFLYFYQELDREPTIKEDEVVRSAQAPDRAEEKQPNRAPNRSIELSSQKKPDALTDDITSAPQPKRSEDAAPEDQLDTDVEANNEPPVAQEVSPQPQPPSIPLSETSLEGVAPTGAPISPTIPPQEAPLPATAPATTPATAPTTAPAPTAPYITPDSSEAGQPSPSTGGTYSPEIPAVAPTAQDVSTIPQIGVN